jgi:hypothetical protein
MRQVVTAGASLSGVTAADALRYECYEGSVVIGHEKHPPCPPPPSTRRCSQSAARPAMD